MEKTLYIFDLDGTLAESKQPLEKNIAEVLGRLLVLNKVAIIGGGKFPLFKRQVLAPLAKFRPRLGNLYIFPLNGAALWRYSRGWERVYEKRLTRGEVQRIMKAFQTTFKKIGWKRPGKTYGTLIENRLSQLTFSALGQNTPLSVKTAWNKKSDVREKMVKELKKLLHGFDVKIGGLTSIDVTKKGINKAYAVTTILKMLGVRKNNAIFFGDAIYKDGNDYSVVSTGVKCVKVAGPMETRKEILKTL